MSEPPTNTDCCICGVKFDGWGNNPAPFPGNDDSDPRCCDDCNARYVIPARLTKGLEDRDYAVIKHFAKQGRMFVQMEGVRTGTFGSGGTGKGRRQ